MLVFFPLTPIIGPPVEQYVKLTINIPPDLLKRLKLHAVQTGSTFSLVFSGLISRFLDLSPDVMEKYRHAGIFQGMPPRRGRPPKDHTRRFGPVFRKKTTIYVSKTLRRRINKFTRYPSRYGTSDLVEISLRVAEREGWLNPS
jgi:hypothetical protein